MTAYSIEELVRQAESEGVTLAEVISRRLSSGDMDALETELKTRMDANYVLIEGFMQDVDVPSIPDFSNLSEQDLVKMQHDVLSALSDESSVAST
jgi:hypothetical protein